MRNSLEDKPVLILCPLCFRKPYFGQEGDANYQLWLFALKSGLIDFGSLLDTYLTLRDRSKSQ